MKNLSRILLRGRAIVGAVCVLAALTAMPHNVAAQSTTGVPVKHAQTNSVRAVQFFAAQKSGDGLMLAVFGNDERVKKVALEAAKEARAAGYPLRGIIFGPTRDDAVSAIEFYADAQLAATFLNPDGSDKAAILAQLRRGYVDIVQPRRAGGQ